MAKLVNLGGYFSGAGFAKKNGRNISLEDCSYVRGPIDLCFDPQSGLITKESSDGIEYDGTNSFAIAGFVDSHTHALFSGQRSREYFMRWQGQSYGEISAQGGGIHNSANDTLALGEEALSRKLLAQLRAMARGGTTCVEVKSGYANSAEGELKLLRAIKLAKRNKGPGIPDFFTTFLGLHALPRGKKEIHYVDSMIAVLPQIKAEGLADFVDAFPEEGFFSLHQALRFVKAAADLGLQAKVHADEITDMKAAEYFATLNVLSVDHLQKTSQNGIKVLALSKTVAALLPATSFFLNLEYTNARRLLNEGVQVALATDFNPGTAPESSFAFTQRLAASQMKMSAAEILCASTFNGAAALGDAHRRGRLEPGLIADLLLYKNHAQISFDKEQELLENLFVSGAAPDQVFLRGHAL